MQIIGRSFSQSTQVCCRNAAGRGDTSGSPFCDKATGTATSGDPPLLATLYSTVRHGRETLKDDNAVLEAFSSIQVLNENVHDDHRMPGLIANLEKFWDLNNEGANVAEIIDQTEKSVWTAGGRDSDERCPNLLAESCTMPPKMITENLVAYFSN